MTERVEIPQSTVQKLNDWYSEDFIRNTSFLKGSFIGWLFGRFKQAGVTVNKRVHLTSKAPDLSSHSGIILIGHELYHVLQQKDMGWWGFLRRYLWRWRPRHIKQGWKHPLEKPAYARGDEIKSALL